MSLHPPVDLILFLGQSNMAGRGIACPRWPQTAPKALPGAGWEYRAITAPGRLSPLSEPFGQWENRAGGLDDGGKKSGSLAVAFINACYTMTGVPVVGLSASEGGTSILQWQPGTPFWTDLTARWRSARETLDALGYPVRHTFVLWCQGETDGDHGMPAEEYQRHFSRFWQALQALGAEVCFLAAIGHYNGTEPIDYTPIQEAQRRICREVPGAVLISEEFQTMRDRGLMKDDFHYVQAAYNEVGTLAGVRAGRYINTLSQD